MMGAIEFVQIEKSVLEDMLYRVSKRAAADALAEQNDELLNIAQLCKRIEGLTYHTFARLKESTHLKCIDGKYSLAAVRKAMQA